MLSSGDRLSAAFEWLKHDASNRAAKVVSFLQRLPQHSMTKAEIKFAFGIPIVQNSKQTIETSGHGQIINDLDITPRSIKYYFFIRLAQLSECVSCTLLSHHGINQAIWVEDLLFRHKSGHLR